MKKIKIPTSSFRKDLHKMDHGYFIEPSLCGSEKNWKSKLCLAIH